MMHVTKQQSSGQTPATRRHCSLNGPCEECSDNGNSKQNCDNDRSKDGPRAAVFFGEARPSIMYDKVALAWQARPMQ